MIRTRRRDFLAQTTLAGAGVCLIGLPSHAQNRSPNEKLNLAIVGVTGRGGSNLKEVSGENIVALCDVDDQRMATVAAKFPAAKTYNDWRKMLDQKDIDAVVVSTTEHTHAFINLAALKLGKHVYCEKPIAHSVYEARRVGDVYRASKVATQQGTQIHSTQNYRRVVELIKAHAIGAVREAHVWCDRSPLGTRERPQGSPPVPAHLHWDLWLGPAPERPYHPEYHTGGCLSWDKRWDFGNGTLGDMGSHLIDLPFWALDLRHPTSVEAQGEPREDETYPQWLTACWEHPARGERGPVKLFWYDGGKRPPTPAGIDLAKWKIGCIFVGEKGTLVADYGRCVLLPEDKYKGFPAPEPKIPPSPGQQQEWLLACKTGSPSLCNFDYAGALVENNLLGCAAFRVGRKLEWDAANLKATNCPEADRYIRKVYRRGWELPG